MLAAGNIFISMMSVGSLSLLYYKVRKPFKGHSFNTFAYIILLLIVYALIGNSIIIHSLICSPYILFLGRQGFVEPEDAGFRGDVPVHKPGHLFLFVIEPVVSDQSIHLCVGCTTY
jgi:hypothetical protein